MKKLSYVIVCFFLFTAAICSCSKDDNPEEEITPSSLPTITNLVQSIASPQPGDQVIISATVTTEKGTTLSAVTLKWTLDGANQTSVAMSNGGTGDVYSGTITGQIAAGVAVAYTVSATNVNGTTDKSGNYTVKALPTPTGYSQLFLNEINGNGSDGDKYIELYNNSTEAINLEGVVIYYNNADSEPEVTWTGTTQIIQSKSFLLLKGTKGSGDLIKGLSATQGVVVELQDPDGNQIDIFRIGEDMSRANSYSRIPDGTGVWYYTDVTGTQNATNGTNTSGLESIIALPWITGLTQDIMFPTATDAVKVSATVRTISGTTLTSVILKWTLDGNAQSDITMANLGNTYSGTIAAQAVGAEIVYTVVATNSENGTAESSEDYTVSSTAIDYSKLVINEIDGNGKFVEIYNNASYDIPLVGITLIKNEETASNKIWWTGLDGAIIEAGKYYTIVQSGLLTPTGASEYTGASGISPKKTLKFELKTSNGTILDTFSRLIEGSSTLDADCLPDYSKTPKYSFSRCPDGIGEFKLAVPSCNAQNPSTSDDPIVTTPLTP